MNIHEYQAKQLFNHYGIATPRGKLASSSSEVKQLAIELDGSRLVVKAQVHAGGRGKVGGVILTQDVKEAEQVTGQLIGNKLVTKQTGEDGLPIGSVLLELPSAIKREFYLSMLVDRAREKLVIIASAAGGMDIEEVAEESPDKILTLSIELATGIQPYQCRKIAKIFAISGSQVRELEKILRGMLQLFVEKDASQVEINPLIETESGELIALDAKINFDDNALGLHDEISAMRDATQEDEKENIAQQIGLNYISLQGNIGCMVNGAGLAMATMDLVKLKGGLPANFLDVGGGTTTEKVAEAFKLILSDPDVKAVLVNIFGGIVQCNIIAEGILKAVEEVHVGVPIVVRLEGTNAEQGRALLNDSDLAVIAADNLGLAAEKVVELAGVA